MGLWPIGSGRSTGFFLAVFILLMGIGFMLSFAASPAVAERIGLDSFHFVKRHALFMMPSLMVMFGLSFLTPRQVRRTAIILLVISLAMMVLALFFGVEVKGSRRWIDTRQLLDPAVRIHEAGLRRRLRLAVCRACPPAGNPRQSLRHHPVRHRRGAARRPARPWPDDPDHRRLGRHVLHGRHAVAVDHRARRRRRPAALFAAYYVFPHVAARIDKFLTGEGDTFQVDTAHEAIIRGDWFGQGPGEGIVKRILPDSHTDFIFSVAAEEFGIIFCMALVVLFAFVVHARPVACLQGAQRLQPLCRRRPRAADRHPVDHQYRRQSQLLPAKGMTLPLISYGGSSLIAICVTAGFILALTRHRPEKRAQERSLFRVAARCAGGVRMTMSKGIILLAAGGTGGHVFPAEALGA